LPPRIIWNWSPGHGSHSTSTSTSETSPFSAVATLVTAVIWTVDSKACDGWHPRSARARSGAGRMAVGTFTKARRSQVGARASPRGRRRPSPRGR
jgi:hypothetical protein